MDGKTDHGESPTQDLNRLAMLEMNCVLKAI